MVGQEEWYKVIGKSFLDADFRAHLLDDPKDAAESMGVRLTFDQVEGIQKLDAAELEAVAGQFQEIMEPIRIEGTMWRPE